LEGEEEDDFFGEEEGLEDVQIGDGEDEEIEMDEEMEVESAEEYGQEDNDEEDEYGDEEEDIFEKKGGKSSKKDNKKKKESKSIFADYDDFAHLLEGDMYEQEGKKKKYEAGPKTGKRQVGGNQGGANKRRK
jgi:hypothetical protein